MSTVDFKHRPDWIDLLLTGSPAALATEQVHVWRTDFGRFTPEAAAELSAAEQQRAGAFIDPLARSRFVASRLFLRRILGAYLGRPPGRLRLALADGGKPSLADPDVALEFNLSHTADRAVLAIATRPVGVDVEALTGKRRILSIARRVFGTPQCALLERLAEPERTEHFVRLWTCFEARQKAFGEGIFGRRIPESDIHVVGFRVDQVHIAAVAVPQPANPPALRFFSFDPAS